LPHCDIVLPVFNGLTYVKDCIASIIENSKECIYQLFVIDDCSDHVTSTYLTKLAADHSQINLHRNSENLGFVKSCNIGISLGKSPYFVLINSDVIVTPGWLSRLLRCAESDPRIASVNPFTNHASNINISMAPGANFYSMDWVLAGNSLKKYPDVVTGVGFCMLLRRSALDEVGLFDEVYGRGYCEESDLCMRLTSRGYRTVVADDVYVYHKGRATFTDRGERYKQNRKIFDRRWASEYKRQFRAFLSANPLRSARDLFTTEQQWDPKSSMRQTYRLMRDRTRKREYLGVIREAARGVRRLPYTKRDFITADLVAGVTRPNRLRVTYVLHHLTVAGGVLSVVQLVNELILLGVEARIVALCEYPEIYDWKFFTRPIIYRTLSELLENFPETDIAVATHWTTAPWVGDVMKSGRAGTGVYFIQDYESWFFPEEDEESRARVNKTYELISHKIVKSDWLKGLLAKDGYTAQKIPLGMDLFMFYPRDIKKVSYPIVLAMARPGTPRRAYKYVISALHQVKRERPDAEIILFGDYLQKKSVLFDFTDAGVITDQNRLAELYSKTDVFLDGSDYQGFGRTALEAMACGAACVVTNVGGVTEYAVDGYNCLTVPPREPGLFSDAILRILKDSELKAKLISGGFATVTDYCHKREARETLKYFETIMKKS
jgi:GT2 family glycosyltransferase/glycosyltransferase involved in cell wall biosynthesis